MSRSGRARTRGGRSAALDRTNPVDYSLMAVAEMPSFVREAERLLTPQERADLIVHLAAYPKAGDLIQDTGGVRKMRWGVAGRGKRGGVRVIYYFHSERMPLYLLTLFAKNERSDLTAVERRALAVLVKHLVRANLGD